METRYFIKDGGLFGLKVLKAGKSNRMESAGASSCFNSWQEETGKQEHAERKRVEAALFYNPALEVANPVPQE